MYVDTRIFLLAFDNAAWRQGGFAQNDQEGVAWVSGNPIIVRDDGISNDPDDSAQKVAAALAKQNLEVLSGSAGSFSAVFFAIAEEYSVPVGN